MQAPLKARGSPRSSTLLPRSQSYNALSRPRVRQPTSSMRDGVDLAAIQHACVPYPHPFFPLPCPLPPTLPPLPQASLHSLDGVWDRMQRGRPMRNALLLLLSLILAANCVWAVQGLAAWRRGHGLRPVGSEQLMLQRLNATVLSVEVRRAWKGGVGLQAARLRQVQGGRAEAVVLRRCLLSFWSISCLLWIPALTAASPASVSH